MSSGKQEFNEHASKRTTSMRFILSLVASVLTALTTAASAGGQQPDRGFASSARARALPGAYQGRRDAERTDRFVYKGKIGRDGRFSLANVDGSIVVTGGSGDEVSIEAVKQARGNQQDLNAVDINVDARAGHVDVQTRYRSRNVRIAVSYTVTVPTSTSVELKSISGDVRVTDVQGSVRVESISGNVTTSGTPRLELARSISGDVDLAGSGDEGVLTASSVSGSVRAKGFKARSLEANTVSGDIVLTDLICDRVGVQSISGNVEFSGSFNRNGRYDFNSHSGDVRLGLTDSTGFEFSANTFSGSVRSDLPLTFDGTGDRGGRRGRQSFGGRAMRATFGDGSAVLSIRTFSGNIVISRR
jgi:DUF4097 and DUF4098 domain-containing protein YvlB